MYELDKNITLNELNTVLGDLNNNKAAGKDGILNGFLKNAPQSLKNVILVLFNHMLSLGVFSQQLVHRLNFTYF